MSYISGSWVVKESTLSQQVCTVTHQSCSDLIWSGWIKTRSNIRSYPMRLLHEFSGAWLIDCRVSWLTHPQWQYQRITLRISWKFMSRKQTMLSSLEIESNTWCWIYPSLSVISLNLRSALYLIYVRYIISVNQHYTWYMLGIYLVYTQYIPNICFYLIGCWAERQDQRCFQRQELSAV